MPDTTQAPKRRMPATPQRYNLEKLKDIKPVKPGSPSPLNVLRAYSLQSNK